MRMIRIYQPGAYRLQDEVLLTDEAGQHVGVVLRMKPNEHLVLFGSDHYEWDAVILSVHKKKVLVKIEGMTEVNRESSLHIHLAQAIAKGERMEWVIQKATELGVGQIQPLYTDYCAYHVDSDRLKKKQQQWQAIAIAACEQCGRNQVPTVLPVKSLDQFLREKCSGVQWVLDPDCNQSWRDYKAPKEKITLLVGPEGGLSLDELKKSQAAGFMPVKIGPRILRTETAAICALSVVQALWGDL